ncbi:glycoside hydrolase family 95 protein [Mediterraneibacter glycyrrhizinilyticus]|uniref:glycoside hydrolase family 95 protein n=1 Tax=Mediterraneibacter glycyrrhizinilyticus TaxID=342942 RepID=UPI00195FA3AC|nr:glycoside hydrolase family 95 protein [Mediterraneibacter glycyrrhizinilyticus]MBM6750568.1 glycoside hydrolase family 95 protein [Mediterraneibacter glycyrrhizinilyticus]
MMKMFYKKPADSWRESIPIGNGRLGGMIFGGILQENLCLNEDSLWSGYPGKECNESTAEKKTDYLKHVRKAVEDEKYEDAEKLLETDLLGEFTESYLPLGTLYIDFESNKMFSKNMAEPYIAKTGNYERGLDLETGIAWVQADIAGMKIKREYFCSYPDQCMVIHIEAERPFPAIKLNLNSELKCNDRRVMSSNEICYDFQCPEHVDPIYVSSNNPVIWGERGKKFTAHIKVSETDGIIYIGPGSGRLCVREATQLTVILTAVKNPDISDSYEILKQRHIADYQKLYKRVELYLGEQPEVPTDKRLRDLREGKEDNPLYALYFQYGRYLLISSSRGSGTYPANLQGIWSWEMRPPWSSNWTSNINVQMNYWPAQKCSLPECAEPYLEWMRHLMETGSITAKKYCDCDGWCANHNIDGWYQTSPVGVPYGSKKSVSGCSEYAWFPLAGVWLCQEVWRAYEYRPDSILLMETVLPILEGAVRFCLDWITPYGKYYVTNPSTSPEHRFEDPRMPGKFRSISMASTIDMSLIKELFINYKAAVQCMYKEIQKGGSQGEIADQWAERLHQAEKYIPLIEQIEPSLYPFKIGRDGRLQEWFRDFREKEKGHRHLSHLYGLFPGELFCGKPKLIDAARKSLEIRIKNGSGYTGWSCAWVIELYAVLGEGDRALAYLKKLLTDSTYDNLWDAHPPLYFQIDGNFGGTSAIADMLVQDRGGKIKILPALPQEWRDGYVKGLSIKGGNTIDISWTKGKIREYYITQRRI